MSWYRLSVSSHMTAGAEWQTKPWPHSYHGGAIGLLLSEEDIIRFEDTYGRGDLESSE